MRTLVTGGGGFLGRAIVKALLKKGHQVTTLQRNDYPFLRQWNATTIAGDLTRYIDIDAATKNCDIVFHVAAKAGVWGTYHEYYQANVVASENVVAACLNNNVPYLVYTSSPSVVFNGEDEEGIDESADYTSRYLNAYQKTKAYAEQYILRANGSALKTVALRPHLIWGADDPHLIPRLIARAKTRRLRLVGHRDNKVDACYIDNAAHSHILAADCLKNSGICAGKAYFIGNDEPIPMRILINKILAAANLPPVKKTMPANIAYTIGGLLESVYQLFKVKNEPIMTRFVAKQLATSHWFDLSAAKRDLNYRPIVSTDQGMRYLATSLLSLNG